MSLQTFQGLRFLSLNPTAPRTLLLLHGAFSSHREWLLVASQPYLSNYHLLIPDLPSHGQTLITSLPTSDPQTSEQPTSSPTSTAPPQTRNPQTPAQEEPLIPTTPLKPIPFSIPITTTLLSNLITTHAKNSRADIIGMSLGGWVSLSLSTTHPSLCTTLFLSGCGRSWPPPNTYKQVLFGYIMFLSAYLTTHLPPSIRTWLFTKYNLHISPSLFDDMKLNTTVKLGQEVTAALAEEEKGKWNTICEGVRSRTLIIAAGEDDPVEETRVRGRCLKKGNGESVACKVEGMRHAWDLQDPELFARGIEGWVERGEVPGEFIRLE